MMGIGTASGDTRAVDAAQQAISSPLLESSIDGATRVCFPLPVPRTWASRRSATPPTLSPMPSTPRPTSSSVPLSTSPWAIRWFYRHRYGLLRLQRQPSGRALRCTAVPEQCAASTEPQRIAPATSPAQAAPTRNVGGTELPNFGNDQFELPDFLKRGSF